LKKDPDSSKKDPNSLKKDPDLSREDSNATLIEFVNIQNSPLSFNQGLVSLKEDMIE